MRPIARVPSRALVNGAHAKPAADAHAPISMPPPSSVLPEGALSTPAVLRMQRQAGNRAVGLLLQRQPKRRPAGAGGRSTPAETDAQRALRLSKLVARATADPKALAEMAGLSDAQLDALESAASTLPRADATLVRRAASYARFWRNTRLADKPGAKLTDQGAEVKGAGATVAGGSVEVRTGATLGSNTGYTLSFTTAAPKAGPGPAKQPKGTSVSGKGATAGATDAQWLQFAWREVVAERPAKGGRPVSSTPVEGKLGRAFGGDQSLFQYWLTTDPKAPNWNTDTSEKSSPFFEEGTGTVERTATTLRMFDAPSPDPGYVKQAFGGGQNAPARVVSHFHATAYLVTGMSVVYRASIDLRWPFEKADVVPKVVAKATGGPVKEIASAHRARLLKQFPDFDYLPGGVVATPALKPRLGAIAGRLNETAWQAKDWRGKYGDVAALAGADRIESVWNVSGGAVHEVSDEKDGTAGRPGLNFAARLVEGGEGTARFVDEAGEFQARLPVAGRGRLPRIAIILGPKAFARDEASALMTLRHEMEHARHLELAVEWLLRWRSERPAKPFWDWIRAQKIPPNVLALVEYAKPGGARASTELLAHVEGLVATLGVLPAAPELRLMRSGDYPPSIASFKMLGDKGYIGSARAVRADALGRLRDTCCADQALRTKLLAWIDALLDPSVLRPQAGDEKAVAMIRNDFGTGAASTAGQKALKGFLEDVGTTLRKPCR